MTMLLALGGSLNNCERTIMHQMKLQEKFFLLIKSGQKNIELRL